MSTETEDEIRQRQRDAFLARLGDETRWVTAPPEELHARRDERLRALVRHAQEHSSWHRERLAGVDVDALAGDDLSALPTMDKADLMDNWDAICTDPELTLEGAIAHLREVAETGPSYLLGRYQVVGTGGSSGHRAIMPWDFEGLVDSALGRFRHLTWVLENDPPDRALSQARLMPTGTMHISAVIDHVFALPGVDVRTYPPSLPADEVIAALQEMQPTVITGYPSLVWRMARAQLAGRLDIAPHWVLVSGEPLGREVSDDVRRAWGINVVDVYGATESGEIAVSNPLEGSGALHRIEDANVVEPVDASGRPVPAGTPADHIYVTNILNRVLPIIRYRVDDAPTYLPGENPGPWTGTRIAPIEGRAYAPLEWPGGVSIDVHGFSLVLRELPALLEFQVRQTPRGIDVDLVLDRDTDLEGPRAEIARQLAASGLDDPQVTLQRVDAVPRNPHTGKIQMFVPLPASA
jgi:phenylacetate-coenzyme A ligase PaaK-like adenylate-forming protein